MNTQHTSDDNWQQVKIKHITHYLQLHTICIFCPRVCICEITHLMACSSRLAYKVYSRFIRSTASSENGTSDVFKIRSTRILHTSGTAPLYNHAINLLIITLQCDSKYFFWKTMILTLSCPHCCHMDTATKHPVPDWVKPSTQL